MNPTHHPASNTIKMQLLAVPEPVTSGREVQLSFKPVSDSAPGTAVPLALRHEAAFHLIVLDASLSWFRHLHPELQPDGSYRIAVTFPYGGSYLLYADYQPEGFSPIVDKIVLEVGGAVGTPPEAAGEQLTAVTGALTARIEPDAPLQTGAATLLPISILREGSRLSAADITPYLGAVAHVILIHKTDRDFLHIHPEPGVKIPVIGHTQFDKPGIYRMWVQFNVDGVLHTADFTLDVKEGNHAAAPLAHQGHHHHG
ncbi:hypothetical protein [Niabella beijingensis]|uniref:hypothetical protein n=1 Tax=Niabella beijingensis TaxID=2872700 RepID=UPI001CC10AFF|nr:hypothetical protein [Niabella beijingensis]MBZ4191866.1 hypothetical protein [Niabella beijingensis]